MMSHTFHTTMGAPYSTPSFYGTATIGTKGQLVIPVEVREKLGLQPGDKVVIFGMSDHSMVGVCPISRVEKLLAHMTTQLETVRRVVEDNNKEERTEQKDVASS